MQEHEKDLIALTAMEEEDLDLKALQAMKVAMTPPILPAGEGQSVPEEMEV